MATGDTFCYAAYVSDNGITYQIKCSTITAAEGHAGSHGPAPDPSLPFWPWPAKCLRHVNGKNDTKRSRLTIFNPGDSLFTTPGGTYNIDAGIFQVLGSEGERRPASMLR